MQRTISRFVIGKTVSHVHESYGPAPTFPDSNYYEDPRNIGRNVEATFSKWNMDVPDQIRESIDSARDGTTPEGWDI